MIDRGRLWIWGAIICILFVALYLVREVLLPFIAGMAVAYFLDPILDRLEKCRLSRLMATIILTTTFFTLIIALITIIVPLLQGQVVSFVQKLPVMIDAFVQWLLPFQQELLNSIPKEQLPELGHLYKTFGGQIVKWGIGLAQGIFDGGVAIFNVISLLVITPIVSFYLLRDWDMLLEKVESWLPREYSDQIREVLVEIDKTIARFVRGQMTVGLLLAVIYSVGLTMVGLDFGLLVGILTGFLSFIPYFGMFIGLLTASAISFFQFGDLVSILLVVVVFVLGQIIESVFLTPKLVGGAVGLHSVWVIFSLMAGGALFGFIGVLLAVPFAAIIGILMRFSLAQYLASAVYIGKVGNDTRNPGEKS